MAVGADLLALALLTPPGRDGRRRRVRQRRSDSACRSDTAVRTRRSSPRAERVRPPDAGPDHRRVGRRARPHGLPHGAGDARAAHPPREGDVEHLHGAGAAGQHGGDVCGVSRPRWTQGDRRARAPDAQLLERDRSKAGLEQRNAHYFDTLRIDVPSASRKSRRRRERRRDQLPLSSTRDDVGIALNETTTDDVARHRGVFAALNATGSAPADLFELPKGGWCATPRIRRRSLRRQPRS